MNDKKVEKCKELEKQKRDVLLKKNVVSTEYLVKKGYLDPSELYEE